jgi:Fe-S cluster assembly protein SufD
VIAGPGTGRSAKADPRTLSHLHPAGSFDLADHPLPSGREEIWRFTPLESLLPLLSLAPEQLRPVAGPETAASGRSALDRSGPDSAGSDRSGQDHAGPDSAGSDRSAPVGSGSVGSVGSGHAGYAAPGAADAAPVTVTVSPADLLGPPLAPGQAPRGRALTPSDRAAALASAATPAATHILLPAGRHLDQPVRVEVVGRGLEASAHQLVIEAGAGAQAVVLLRHSGVARLLANVEVVLGAGAELTLVSLQDWDPGAQHLGQHEALVGPGAEYRHIVVSLGGDLVRLQSNVSYRDRGGKAELFGLYFARAGQHLEHRLFVDHNHPKSVSLADYRGALRGSGARSVWIGDVLIRPQAEGIETYESNKNLVLSDGCRADAVPNLEIETGDIVGAGHSASTGRFDQEQLFYLGSRGLPPDEARRLVVRGFFAQLLARIRVAEVEQALMERLDRELAEPIDPLDQSDPTPPDRSAPAGPLSPSGPSDSSSPSGPSDSSNPSGLSDQPATVRQEDNL